MLGDVLMDAGPDAADLGAGRGLELGRAQEELQRRRRERVLRRVLAQEVCSRGLLCNVQERVWDFLHGRAVLGRNEGTFKGEDGSTTGWDAHSPLPSHGYDRPVRPI